jgi:magnesium-transporting ATPase (P-type)
MLSRPEVHFSTMLVKQACSEENSMPENTPKAVVAIVHADKVSVEDTLKQLQSSLKGLSGAEAQRRQQQFGPNALEEANVNPWLKFLSYFWGPISWMIEAAALLSAFNVKETSGMGTTTPNPRVVILGSE